MQCRSCALFVLLAVVVCSTSGCSLFRDVSLFSTEQEKEIGRKVSKDIEAQAQLLDKPSIVNYVQEVGNRVAEYAPRQKEIDYRFHVVDNAKNVNAFAVPGGNIYIFTGLLARMNTEAELAAVLSHEAAHIAERHSMEALTRQVGYALVAQAVLGENPAAWQKVLTQLGGKLSFLSYSRLDEKEADELGLKYMYEAGYDPQGMVNLLQLFVELSEREPSAIKIWLSSHPAPGDRVEMVKELIAKNNLKDGAVDEQQYEAIMGPLKAK